MYRKGEKSAIDWDSAGLFGVKARKRVENRTKGSGELSLPALSSNRFSVEKFLVENFLVDYFLVKVSSNCSGERAKTIA